MRKLTSIVMLLLAVGILLPACKYAEGPAISLRSKTARVVNIWKLDKAWQNGIEVTASWESFQPGLTTEFKDDGFVVYTWVQNSAPVSYSAQWEFNSDKSGLVITDNAISTTWDILRLKNDELWLKRTVSGITTTIEEVHYITK